MTVMARTLPPPPPEQVQAALLRAIERTGVRFMVTPKPRPAAAPAKRRTRKAAGEAR
jgi:hypothetical protein